MCRIVVTLLLAAIATASEPGSDGAIRRILDEQAAAWNRGDLKAFVETYDPEAVFAGTNVTRGREEILRRYRNRYRNAAEMGTLTFSDVEVRALCGSYASAIGHWHLKRKAPAGGDANGVFTLLLRRQGNSWLIVLDHSS